MIRVFCDKCGRIIGPNETLWKIAFENDDEDALNPDNFEFEICVDCVGKARKFFVSPNNE